MRFVAACWLSALLASAAFAPAEASETAAAPPELADVLERMATSAGVEARFEERKELALLAAPLESRGVIYFSPPDRFARFTLAPGFTALVVDGEAVQLREGRDGDLVDLSGNPVARVFVDNIVVLWSGDREQLERHYTAEFRGTLADWELRLAPRREPLSRVIDAITLHGDADDVREMRIIEKDGDRTITRFETLSSDRSFSAVELERIFDGREPLGGSVAERSDR